MLSYVKKFVMDILPSVAATIIGAYIVNHYIVARPATPAAAISADAAKPADKSTVVGSLPEAGVKAKGMSERTLLERSASEKATVTEKPEKSIDLKSTDLKAADAPDTASIAADPRHHPAAPKSVAKLTPAVPQPTAPAATSAAPVEAAVTPEEARDANDLARAAIERLRKERPQEAARPQDASRPADLARLPEQPRAAAASAIRPLPPPIMVSNPSSANADQASQPRPPYAADAQDPNRMTPPADIPVPVIQAPPLDLRAEANMPTPKDERRSVADDMLSGVKSVFHAVLPK